MNEDAATYLQEWFDRMAPGYDRLERLLAGVRPQVVEMAAAPLGARVLDAATGTGNQAMAFAAAGYEVTGIDLSAEMIRVARGKEGRGKATFLNADASAIPFGDGSFEVSIISFALHDMPGPMRDKALGELVRVTNPGGIIMVVDYEIPSGLIHRLFIRFMLSRYENVYVPAFFCYDLEGALVSLGLNIEEKRPVLRGVGRILKCRKPVSRL
jgi:demethylmenaquinone methyltransferase/2-methoxy-6-polyprenyl-1,4-benzoquinol methylase